MAGIVPTDFRRTLKRMRKLRNIANPTIYRAGRMGSADRILHLIHAGHHMLRSVSVALLAPMVLLACSKQPDALPSQAVLTTPAAKSSIAWVKPVGTDVDSIFAQAKALNKPVFLYWGAVWCPPCNQIKAAVFSRPDFIERSQGFVPVYLDGDTPGAQQLGARFKVRGYPTMILFRPDGTELTRLPGEVDAARYMQVLAAGLSAASPIKETLSKALAEPAGALDEQAWRLLAFYSWETDEAQLVSAAEMSGVLQKLAARCPANFKEAATHLELLSLAAAGKDKAAKVDQTAALPRVQRVLRDATEARQHFDILLYQADTLVKLLTSTGTPERLELISQWNTALDRLAKDASLSRSDQLSAVYAKVQLAKLDLPKSPAPKLAPELVTQARQAVLLADQQTIDHYERQSVIPSAADLLSEAGLLVESDALLKAELAHAVSPYYHMLVLSGNAQVRGDKTAALSWAQQAYEKSQGPATRLQWGAGYVGKLIELTPGDVPRIAQAVGNVIADLNPAPETFYERNQRVLERMGGRLNAWNAHDRHAGALKKMQLQLDGVCAKLPKADPAHTACQSVFKTKPTEKRA
jgi:thioredoxin-related protein